MRKDNVDSLYGDQRQGITVRRVAQDKFPISIPVNPTFGLRQKGRSLASAAREAPRPSFALNYKVAVPMAWPAALAAAATPATVAEVAFAAAFLDPFRTLTPSFSSSWGFS